MTVEHGTVEEVSKAELRTVVLQSLVGTTVEWYDFFLYGTAAGIVFPSCSSPAPSRPSVRCSPSRDSPSASSHGRWAAPASLPDLDYRVADTGANSGFSAAGPGTAVLLERNTLRIW